MKSVWVLLLACSLLLLSACGGGGSSTVTLPPPQLSGNWQFSMANPPDQSFQGGLQGGFLLETNGSVHGSAMFSVFLPQPPPTPPTLCNSGSASITGTLSGQKVTITAIAGTQTFTFTGTLSADNTTVVGTYASTDGTAQDGSPCGTAQTGLSWSATTVPLLSGGVQGSFHSTSGANGLQDQDFQVVGSLIQGENTGASNATVTGSLTFIDPVTLVSDYPCMDTVTLTGQVSGNTVILQIFGKNGLNVGQIGNILPDQPVTFDRTPGGRVVHNMVGLGYAVNTKTCPGASLTNAGDSGNICLSFGGTKACSQPITLSPASLIFPPQMLGAPPSAQTVTLTNTDPAGAALDGLTLAFLNPDGSFGGPSDFNGLPSFIEQDTCASSPGAPFTLVAQQSCAITISFAPQQSCPWLPSGTLPFGAPPAQCPVTTTATLTVKSPKSADNDTDFAVPISGTGLSAIVASVQELDFGAQAVGGASTPQMLTFTNQSVAAVQILPAASTPCAHSDNVLLPHPIQDDGSVDGIRMVRTDSFASIQPNPPSISYFCDVDVTSGEPNLQISSNTCLGRLLAPHDTCSLQVAFVPQPGTNLSGTVGNGLDYFLELNTLQCSADFNITTHCEIDSGRFPVELRTNPPSPIRMSPGAGLDFGGQLVGQRSATQKVVLFNDPTDPNTAPVNISGIVLKGDYGETDDCPAVLTQGASCTLTITFTPKSLGYDPGSVTISYNGGQIQTVYLRGTGQ